MKMLINTIKWDALDHWRYSVRWVLLGALGIWVLGNIFMLITPGFSLEIAGTDISFLPELSLSLLIFIGGFLMYLYPVISTVYDVVSSRRVSERLVNRPYVMAFGVKLLFNVLAFLLGYFISSLAPGGALSDFLGYIGAGDVDVVSGPQIPIFRTALFFPTSIAFYVVAYQTILSKGISRVFSIEGIISLLLALLLVFNGIINMPAMSELALFVAAFIMIVFLYEKKFEI